MKAKSALMAAAIIVITPAIAVAAQPAQTPPAQGATQAQNPASPDNATADPAKGAAKMDPACDTSTKTKGKSADADAKTSSSAKVGKDTGVVPTPRTKKTADAACATQPQ